MGTLFWISFALVAYAYAGYGLCLRWFVRRRPTAEADPSFAPHVSVIVAARNGVDSLPAKLADLRAQSYGRDRLQIIVVSDGSTDGTMDLLREQPDVEAVEVTEAAGKANALNCAVARATGDILVFFDTRQRIAADTIARLVAPLGDPNVGAVSGELLLVSQDGTPDREGLGLYWRIEKAVRRLESATGSVVGVTGAIYAARRALYTPMPRGLILDDVWVPMHVARQGGRVLFEPAAVALDRLFQEPGREFSRKVRTLAGNYELVQRAPWLLTPANPLLLRFISHKLLRLAVPLLLLVMLLTSGLAHGPVYRTMFLLQLVVLALAALGWWLPALRRQRLVNVPYTFLLLNAAAAVALYRWLARHDVWADESSRQPSRR